MVLPVRIELTTSALPRMRSTTELRQHINRADNFGHGLIEARLWTKAVDGSRRSDVIDCAMAKRDTEREARLAAALRENLRKRKVSKAMPEPKLPEES
jgi:hypothetical protein